MTDKKRKGGDLFLLLAMLAVFLFFSVGIFADTSPRFSENDNRYLADPPALSSPTELAASLWNGTFGEELGAFYSDRLPLRQSLLSLRSRCELALGKKEVNGIVIGSSGILYQAPEADTALLEKNLGYIGGFSSQMASNGIPTSLLCIPDRLGVTEESGMALDLYKSRSDRAYSLLDSISDQHRTDVSGALLQAHVGGSQVYFSTDHHLTAYGAYLAYCEYISSLGLSPISEAELTHTTLSESFLGSYHSRLSLGSGVTPDTLTLLRYEGDESYTLTIHDTGEVRSTFYNLSYLEKKDKYSVFLGGNHGRLTVCGGKDRPRLLIFKDSYANAMIPYLSLHFDLDVIDLRYYSGDIRSLTEDGGYDRILILYGINTLSGDISPRRLSLLGVSS